jgi:hypothetical protein
MCVDSCDAFYSFQWEREKGFGEKKKAALGKGAAYCFRAFSYRAGESVEVEEPEGKEGETT